MSIAETGSLSGAMTTSTAVSTIAEAGSLSLVDPFTNPVQVVKPRSIATFHYKCTEGSTVVSDMMLHLEAEVTDTAVLARGIPPETFVFILCLNILCFAYKLLVFNILLLFLRHNYCTIWDMVWLHCE